MEQLNKASQGNKFLNEVVKKPVKQNYVENAKNQAKPGDHIHQSLQQLSKDQRTKVIFPWQFRQL